MARDRARGQRSCLAQELAACVCQLSSAPVFKAGSCGGAAGVRTPRELINGNICVFVLRKKAIKNVVKPSREARQSNVCTTGLSLSRVIAA